MVKHDPQNTLTGTRHHRHSIRLQGFDYASAGGYFVTIVTWHRECLFGNVIDKHMQLNKVGKIVEWEWLELPKRLPYVSLGAYVVMPNHFHGILFIHEPVGATRQGPTESSSGIEPLQIVTKDGIDGSPLRPNDPTPASLGASRQGQIRPPSSTEPLQSITNDGIVGSPLRPNGPKPASLGAILAQFKSRVTKRIWKIPKFEGTPIWQRNYYEHIIRDETALQNMTRYIEANPLLWEEDQENPALQK